jgi:hypothetical protein
MDSRYILFVFNKNGENESPPPPLLMKLLSYIDYDIKQRASSLPTDDGRLMMIYLNMAERI